MIQVTLGQAASIIERTAWVGQTMGLVGPPGMGKTMLGTQLADKLDAKYFARSCASMDAVDNCGIPSVMGGPQPENKYTYFAPPRELQRLTHNAPKEWMGNVIYVLDDLGTADPIVQPSLFRFLNERELPNGEKIRDNVLILFTTNRASDGAGANDLNTALRSRVTMFDIVHNSDEWRQWARHHGVLVEFISFIEHLPQYLMDFDPNSTEFAYPCPRSVTNASKLLKSMEGAEETDKLAILQGTVGQGFASAYLSFCKCSNRMTKPEDICRDPEGCSLPEATDMEAKLTTIEALHHHVLESADGKTLRDRCKAMLTLAHRFRKEHDDDEMGARVAQRVFSEILHDVDDPQLYADLMKDSGITEIIKAFRSILN